MDIVILSGRYPWIGASSEVPVPAAKTVNRDTAEQIAKCMDCPLPECIDCIGRSCSPRKGMFERPGRPESFSDRALVSLLHEGKSDREISAMLSVTVQAVRYRKRKLECESKTK